MLCASTVFGMGQSALAAPAGGDETSAEDAPSETTTSVDPTSPASGEATATPAPAATTPAATDAPAAAESPATATTAPTLINPEGAKGPSALVGPEALVTPLTVGTPDGGMAPYVYWTVKDEAGNLVPGATFKFEYRSGGSWSTGTNASAITDCAGTCSNNTSGNSLDRDGDGGEWLLEHRGTSRESASNRITTGSNYRVSQVTAPTGYKWVASGSNTKTIGAGNSNTATWNGTDIHDFGVFTVAPIPTGNDAFIEVLCWWCSRRVRQRFDLQSDRGSAGALYERNRGLVPIHLYFRCQRYLPVCHSEHQPQRR